MFDLQVLTGLVLAFIVGCTIGAVTSTMATASKIQEAIAPMQQMQAKCEQSLPRDQKCVVMFVPQQVKQP